MGIKFLNENFMQVFKLDFHLKQKNKLKLFLIALVILIKKEFYKKF